MNKPFVPTINQAKEIRDRLALTESSNDPRVMVNVGALRGADPKKFAKMGWEVFAFEANPVHYDFFKPDAELPNYHPIRKAITIDDSPEITFYVSDQHPGIGSLNAFHTHHRPIRVPAMSLKVLYEEEKIREIDYFKIDAETMDVSIMKTHDWNIPIKGLLMEYTFRNLDEVYEFAIGKNPKYRHVIFEWVKPKPGASTIGDPPADCVRMSTIDRYRLSRVGEWGDILFYEPAPGREVPADDG